MNKNDIPISSNISGAYKIIKDVLNLTHVKDNIFEEPNGRRLYLDRYGFHTTLQTANLLLDEVKQMRSEAKQAISNANNMKNQYIDLKKSIIDKKTRKYLTELLYNKRYSPEEKVKIILNYLR